MTTELTHWIDGKHVKGTSGRFADVYNPATGEVQAKVALATKAEVDAAVAKAAEAQIAWGATNPQRRARVMMKFGALINDARFGALLGDARFGAMMSDAAVGGAIGGRR